MISIILPTYNEKENIAELISQLSTTLKQYKYELIVVDDDSPDLTWKTTEELHNPNVKVIRRMGIRGIASAIHDGIKSAKGEYIGWMDCDLSMPPSALIYMKDALDEGNDIVIGSRYVKGGKDYRPFTRRFTSLLFNSYARMILGGVKDYDSGFILLKKEVLSQIGFPANGYGEYFVEFMYKAKKKFKIYEAPYILIDRQKGTSKTANSLFQLLGYGIQYGIKVLKLRFS